MGWIYSIAGCNQFWWADKVQLEPQGQGSISVPPTGQDLKSLKEKPL